MILCISISTAGPLGVLFLFDCLLACLAHLLSLHTRHTELRLPLPGKACLLSVETAPPSCKLWVRIILMWVLGAAACPVSCMASCWPAWHVPSSWHAHHTQSLCGLTSRYLLRHPSGTSKGCLHVFTANYCMHLHLLGLLYILEFLHGPFAASACMSHKAIS